MIYCQQYCTTVFGSENQQIRNQKVLIKFFLWSSYVLFIRLRMIKKTPRIVTCSILFFSGNYVLFFFLFQYSFLGRRQKAERAWRAGDLKDICRLDSATNFFLALSIFVLIIPGETLILRTKEEYPFLVPYILYMQKVLKIFASPKEILQNAFYYVLVKRGVGGLISI